MGWTSYPMHKPVKEWFKEQWGYDKSDYEVLDSALVHRTKLYGAIRKKSTGEVFCAVFLIHWSRDEYNFSYKDMTEHSGPGAIDCPEKIFKLLTPLNDENDPNGFAKEWRAEVEKFHAKRKATRKLKNCVVKMPEPLKFTSGSSYQYFLKEGKTITAGAMMKGQFISFCRVRLNLNCFDYEVVKSLN